jgi:uncharacterized small protein (DUF1192 family)
MITREEWLAIPLEARLVEHATHSDDELLRDDLIAAVAKIDSLSQRIADLQAETLRLERLSASIVTPY